MSYFCFQANQRDCGFAALKMLLANEVKSQSYLYIDKPPEKRENYTFQDLIDIACDYGFILKAYKVSDRNVYSLNKHFIVLINKNHMVYVRKVFKRKILYFDPAIGKQLVSIDTFLHSWEGEIIEIADSSQYTKLSIKKRELIPSKMNFIKYGISLLSGLAIMASMWFLNKSDSLIITMIFIVLFVGLELVDNWYLIKVINYFDNNYLTRFLSNENEHNYKSYAEYQNFKKSYFASTRNFVSCMVLLAIVICLLAINEIKNLYMVLLITLLILFEKVVCFKSDEKVKQDISTLENEAFIQKKQFGERLLTATLKANKFALSVGLRKFILMFMSLAFAFLMMHSMNIISANFLILHFGMYYIVANNVNEITNYFLSNKSLQKAEASFFDKL